MKDTLALLFAISFTLLPADTTRDSAHSAKAQLVHFVVINMSGSSRALHHRDEIVPLPVAQRVSIQVPAGDPVYIKSDTNSKIETVIDVKRSDEGRLIPVR